MAVKTSSMSRLRLVGLPNGPNNQMGFRIEIEPVDEDLIMRNLALQFNSTVPRPEKAFSLYYEEQLATRPWRNRWDVRQECFAEWKKMPDEKKIVWINSAEQQQKTYETELNNFYSTQTGFEMVQLKSILTKQEKKIRDRLAGKPKKPPPSGYCLFVSEVFHNNCFRELSPNQRLTIIGREWTSFDDKTKEPYENRIKELKARYEQQYTAYLKKLPAEKRLEEAESSVRKRKAKIIVNGVPAAKKLQIEN